jgi:hypothetical protein
LEIVVTLVEKVYLVMILVMFFGFMIVLFTLSWQDAKLAQLRRRREAAPNAATQSGMPAQSQTAAQH